MNLGRMCEAAARYSDRYDEYVKTRNEAGKEEFEGEALHWFKIFRDAINEAYFEIARTRMSPDMRVECVLGNDRVISMEKMEPEACGGTCTIQISYRPQWLGWWGLAISGGVSLSALTGWGYVLTRQHWKQRSSGSA